MTGDLDPTEFNDILVNIGLHISQARADKLFKTCDPGRKGAMDVDELPMALYTNSMLSTRRYTSPKDVFDFYDKEQVGKFFFFFFFCSMCTLKVESSPI
jgi:Ca2+-binding EF-hand superfamily protein